MSDDLPVSPPDTSRPTACCDHPDHDENVDSDRLWFVSAAGHGVGFFCPAHLADSIDEYGSDLLLERWPS